MMFVFKQKMFHVFKGEKLISILEGQVKNYIRNSQYPWLVSLR